MKKLFYSMLALFCVAVTFTSCGSDDVSDELPDKGSKNNPYSVADAIDAVKDLTWTSNAEYDKTGDVYVKGKISRISSYGTYSESGSYGNASFYISDDGDEENEFFCFRILYLGNQKFVPGQTDIKVGDEVIVCGKLMNYKNNTPETVSGGAYLFSLMRADNSGSDSESSNTVSFATNSDTQTWVEETDGVYGAGFCATNQNLKIGFYRHTCSSALVSPNSSALRIYKNSVLNIATTNGKKMKKIIIGCAPDNGTASYCFDMVGLEGGASAVADKSALTVTWSGSASKVVLHAITGQVRMEKITVEFE